MVDSCRNLSAETNDLGRRQRVRPQSSRVLPIGYAAGTHTAIAPCARRSHLRSGVSWTACSTRSTRPQE
jgi:hypothetical protein